MKGKLFCCGWCCPISHSPVPKSLESHSGIKDGFSDPPEIVSRDPVTLKQICVQICAPAMNKMWIFIFWSDTRVAINCSSSLFSRWGVAEDWCCSFREMFSWWGKELFDGHQQFVSSFSGSKIQTRGWNKQPVNFPFTVVSWKWRTGILQEPSKPGNKCTISCRKVLKAISAHLRIIMHFKPICWNRNIIMGKEINAQWEVSWRWHRVFCGTRWNEWNRGVFGEANNGDVVGKRR